MDHVSWKALIKLSLVSIPVQAYTAEKPANEKIAFHQLHEGHARIQYHKVCPTHGEVPNDEIVKGYEYAKGEYVVIEPDELERLSGDHSFAVHNFVHPAEIDPIYFSGKTYYLLPDGPAGQKPYGLLQEAMVKERLYAVGERVSAGRPELMVLRPLQHILTVSAIHYVTELRDVSEFSPEKLENDFSSKELELTKALIEASTTEHFDLGQYHDVYEEHLRELIESKLAGKEIAIPQVGEPRATINLMDALRESLAQVKKPDGKTTSTRKSGSRRKQNAPIVRQVARRKAR